MKIEIAQTLKFAKMVTLAFTTGSIFFFVVSAQAREFYSQKNKITMTYTSIETGTKPVFEIPIEIRLSDDSAFCNFYLGSYKDACKIQGTFYESSASDTYLIKDGWLALFNHLKTQGVLDATYAEKLDRIFKSCTKENSCNFWIMKDTEQRFQIDDDQPEAFHLSISAGSDPIKLK